MKPLHLVLGGVAAMALSATAAAAVIVVRSSGPSASAFPPGKALPDSQALTLKPNDVVVLLDSRGTRTLRGPGRFSAAADSGGQANSAVAAVTAQNSRRRVRVGAVRGGPTGATQGRNVWQADVGRSGSVCVDDPAKLGLYRASAAGEADVVLRDAATGKTAIVHFNPGQSIAAWPEGIPAGNGAKVQTSGAGSATLTFKSIAPVPAGLEGLAQSLIRNDCQAQLDVLIDTFSAPAAG